MNLEIRDRHRQPTDISFSVCALGGPLGLLYVELVLPFRQIPSLLRSKSIAAAFELHHETAKSFL